ncbi:MAG TPA: hypothetical protein VE956_16430 [Nodularia sp. (in: cyanobacteria)]|nr:hypothetical protein [Nodularia sp. (in: cyanobacteria)]
MGEEAGTKRCLSAILFHTPPAPLRYAQDKPAPLTSGSYSSPKSFLNLFSSSLGDLLPKGEAIANNFDNQFISALLGQQSLNSAMLRAQNAANQQIRARE